jgi:hypothetical protein
MGTTSCPLSETPTQSEKVSDGLRDRENAGREGHSEPRGPLGSVAAWLAAGIFAGLAWRELRFVNIHAVNMMYGDQWDIYQPMFLGQGWWETFDLQHGPHRQGIGLVLTRILAGLSGWDSRWDAFATSLIMIGAAALGIRLAFRFGIQRRPMLLAALPLLFLNVHQYEIFTGAVNLSYGAVPMFLFMAYCLCWFMPGNAGRLLAIGALTFLLIFSGFGLFVGILTPPLVGIEAAQAFRARQRSHAILAILAFAITGCGWALFARGYTFQPAVAGFRFPYERPLEYLVFAGRMLGNFFGAAVLSREELAVGLTALLCLAAIGIWNAIRCVRRGVTNEPRSVVLFCLATFALLFCANCAIGRVFTGPIAPLAPRYASLLIPAGLAIFLQLGELAKRRRFAWLPVLYTLLLVPGTAIQRPDEIYGANWYSEGRRSWKDAFLKTHDEGEANRISNFSVYPAPLGERLRYLEDHKLNLFLPPAP